MKIVTDSAVDLPEGMLEQYGIEHMPLLISFGNESLRSGIDIQPEEFYRRLAASTELPTTSQPSVGEFVELYCRVGQSDHQILSIHISSGLSGTINSARLAAAQCPELNITVIDSKSLSGAQGFQLIAAAQAIRCGQPLDQILARIQQVAAQTDIFYTLDTLHYLEKGGRLGRVQALAGAVLHLKPVITVDKGPGTYIRAGTTRSLVKSMHMIADLVYDKVKDYPAWVHILHSNTPQHARDLAELVTARLPTAKITTGQIVPVLGVHVGPGCVGAVCGPADILN